MPRKALIGAVAVGASALLAGCSQGIENGALPSTPDITNQTGTVITLWNGSWIAALAVGVLTWGLILWCVAVYRKRKDDNKLPVQNRVHLPLELMYTALPLMAVGVLFKYTAEDIQELTAIEPNPDIEIQVVGKQWSWDFNYLDDDVYETGQHAVNVGSLENELGGVGTNSQFPTLYLPVNEVVEFQLESRDVIHSFWIPAFLDKMDMIPFRTNVWQVTPTREGVYAGKCAELCGEFHSGMLFNVAVVSREEYDAHMAELEQAGQTGQLGLDLNRQQSEAGNAAAEGEN